MSGGRGTAEVPYPLGVSQSITTAGVTARTANPVGDQTRSVLIHCDESCYYVFGDNAVDATTSNTFLPANSEHYVRIPPGSYVAAIQQSAGGTLHVSELDG